MCLFIIFSKLYFFTVKNDDSSFKIICQRCNCFVTCKGSSGEMLHIIFIYAVLSTLRLYPGEFDTEKLLF